MVARGGEAPAPCETPARGCTTAGGRLAWVVGDELDLVGDLWADLALPIGGDHALFAALEARTAIAKAASDLTFLVRDVEYDLRAGWRGRTVTAFAGRRGKTLVDAEGTATATYVAAGYESPGFRRYGPGSRERIEVRVAAGPVLDDRGVDAAAVLFGGASLRLYRAASGGTWLALDLDVDGLIDGGRLLADAAAGPRLSFAVDGGRRASFYALYQRSRNPLGLDEDVWLAGFTYEEGRAPASGEPGAPPEIDGIGAAGAGEGRLAGELLLRFLSPSFAADLRAVAVVDANVVTGDDVNELYYRYHVGLERDLGRAVAGGYFYHRSNHVLSEPNDTVTSINVIEGGIETRGFSGPVRAPGRRFGLDGRLRAGYLVDSSFGEDVRWHARGGIRIALGTRVERFVPYLRAEAEAGDVHGTSVALGCAVAPRLAAEVEHREDDQLFGADDSVLLVALRYAL